jgi:hypothetical protein
MKLRADTPAWASRRPELVATVCLVLAVAGCMPGDGAGEGGGTAGAPATGGAGAGGGAGGTAAGGGGATAGGAGGGPAGTGGAGAAGAGTGGAGGGEAPPDAATGGAPGMDSGAPADSASSPPADAPVVPRGPGKIVLVAGGGNGGDGSPAIMASTNRPFGAVTDPLSGEVYIAEYGGRKVRKIDKQGIISTVMGAGAAGPGGRITLGQPHNLLFQPNTHNLFVADTFAGRVIKMDVTTGEAAVFAGRGSNVAPGFGNAFCLSFDPTGEHLYVTGSGVTIIDLKTLAVTRVNTATPRVIAVDSRRNLYLGGGGSLRVADPMGRISDVMGSGGLAAPKHLSIDLEDNVIITDTESDTIRKWVAATKSVVKIAGGGSGALGGAPENARFARPHGAYVDAQGSIWIADSFNNRVVRIDYAP